MEDKEDEKILKYALIILVILIGFIFIIGISMMDFSKNKAEQSIVQNEKKDRNNVKIQVEEEKEQEELDIENPLKFIYSNGKRKTAIITKDKITITSTKEEEGFDSCAYILFDENNILQDMIFEIYCEDESELNQMLSVFEGTMVGKNITIDGYTIIIDYPFDEGYKFLTRKDIEKHLSQSYNLYYED